MGVLLVNLLASFRISLFAHIAGSDAPLGFAGRTILSFLSIFVEFKPSHYSHSYSTWELRFKRDVYRGE